MKAGQRFDDLGAAMVVHGARICCRSFYGSTAPTGTELRGSRVSQWIDTLAVLQPMGIERLEADWAVSDVEAEMDDVAVLDGVGFALQADQSHLASRSVVPCSLQVVERDHFGPDEASLDVRVNGACGLQGRKAFGNGPGFDFVVSHGEKRRQVEE